MFDAVVKSKTAFNFNESCLMEPHGPADRHGARDMSGLVGIGDGKGSTSNVIGGS